MIELDHVLLVVSDLETAALVLEKRYELVSLEGGRHPGWGTANRIVPLGETYLELITVVDEAEAAQSAFGRWVAEASSAVAAPLGWAVRTDDLDDVAGRLGLDVAAGSRAIRDGRLLRWRVAGIAEAAAEPSLPFFIEWAHGTPHPGRTQGTHGAPDRRIVRLELEGDAERLAAWLGQHDLPLVVRLGTPAVASVILSGTAGEIVLDAERLSRIGGA